MGDLQGSKGCEINFTHVLPDGVASYVRDSLAANTRRAYLSDLAHFEAWGGTIPAPDTMVADYLAQHCEALSVATLSRRLASIAKAHCARGLPSPTKSELVKATLRGIKRQKGTAQKEAKPLLRDDLFQVLAAMGNDAKSIRDRVLLLIGFAGGFRRSELVGLDVEDIEHVRQGIVVTLRRSKTDQLGQGRKIGIPLGRMRWCPVTALDEWLTRCGIETGPIFQRINRHGHIQMDRLSGEAVALVIRERLKAAGFDPTGYSGHSLRAGFATSAAQAGVSSWKIRAQTGHASDAMLARYIRDGELFSDNAAGALL
ncbi:site-specific integrase [Microbaculum sp. FT89]|uniref:site-specific integrase n=1 Tax=Microbaculum sp. FT89 TaxID=3447298 RepID=UPI003F536ED1